MRGDAHRQPVVRLEPLNEVLRDGRVDLVKADNCGAILQPLVDMPRQFDHFAVLLAGEGEGVNHAYVEACCPERRGIGHTQIRPCHREQRLCGETRSHCVEPRSACIHYVCIHAYMHTCIHAYIRKCIAAYRYACVDASMHRCIHLGVRTCMRAHAHMYRCISA